MKTTEEMRRYVATDQLRVTIKAQGRSFRWIAQSVGYSDSHFNRVLSGERWMHEDDARAITTMLDEEFSVLWKVAKSTPKVVIATERKEAIPA